MTASNDLMTVPQVADYLLVSRSTVERYIRDGKLATVPRPVSTHGVKRYLLRSEVDAFINNDSTKKRVITLHAIPAKSSFDEQEIEFWNNIEKQASGITHSIITAWGFQK